MHSLETGIIVAIASIFFLTFLVFTMKREVNVSNEIKEKIKVEEKEYSANAEKKYSPEIINNIIDIIVEGEKTYVGKDEK